MKCGLSREALNQRETMSITLPGPQRTEIISGGEQRTSLAPVTSPGKQGARYPHHRSAWPRTMPLTCRTWAQEEAAC